MLYTIDRWHLPAWSWWWLTVCHTYLWGRWRLPSRMVLMVTDCLPHLPVGQVTLTFQNGLDGDWLFATPTCGAGDAYLPAWSWWWLTVCHTYLWSRWCLPSSMVLMVTDCHTYPWGRWHLPAWSWPWLTDHHTYLWGRWRLPSRMVLMVTDCHTYLWGRWLLPSSMVLMVTDCLAISTSTSNISPSELCSFMEGMASGVLPTLKADHIHCKYP